MAEYREVIIDWKYHKSWFLEALEEKTDLFEGLFNEEKIFEEKGVLYQIYCDSHIYGQEVLAYIGQTGTNFKSRFDDHIKSYFAFSNNISFRIGKLKEEDKDDLITWESILIANHKPFYNKTHIHTVKNNEIGNHNDNTTVNEKVIIINNGNHGSLKNSCTNFWWV